MNRSFAALVLGCAMAAGSPGAFASAASPEMGPTPSQMGIDPRTQGSDVQRQGTDMDKGDPATGIRRGMNTGNMGNGTQPHNDDADLPGGDSTGSGTLGTGSKGSTGGASSAGGVGG
jgi:hypothetical protein